MGLGPTPMTSFYLNYLFMGSVYPLAGDRRQGPDSLSSAPAKKTRKTQGLGSSHGTRTEGKTEQGPGSFLWLPPTWG